jgi:hypothetical protein
VTRYNDGRSNFMNDPADIPTCPPQPAQGTHLMQCMEVWGGNQCVDSSCTMAGLDAWVYSRAYANATAGGDVYYVSSARPGGSPGCSSRTCPATGRPSSRWR